MQNHYVISSKTLFWNQNIQNFTKSPDLDMSGPEKSWFGHVRTCPGGQVLTSNHRKYFYFFRFYKYLVQTIGNTFIFWDFTPFHFLWPVLTSKQRKYFYFSDFTPFHFLLANLSFFIKSCVFMIKFIIFYKIKKKYGPIWAPTRTFLN